MVEFISTDGDIDDMLVFEAEDQHTCLTDREFCGGVLSDPLDPAQKTARSRRMDIDVIGAAISQSPIQQPLDIGAVANVAERIDAHVVGIVGAHRHQPVPHNLRNDVRPLEPLAGLGVKEYRTWCPIDPAFRNDRNRATQAHRSEILRGSVGRGGVIRDLAMQRITGVITASLPETNGARSVHRNASKTDHRSTFEMSYQSRV
jgi:hypothetical protein